MLSEKRKDICALLGLVASLFIFYPTLFLVRAAALLADHLEQHYPWAYLFASHIKKGIFPYWTDLIHCGFPIAAESQIGLYYLPNLFLYYFFPFHFAYSYMSVFHFAVAGVGTYAYGKILKLSSSASFYAAIIFLFGAAYGGAYYNITSLKTICWFPLGLFLFEHFLIRKRISSLVALALLMGMSMLAGYLQMAALTWLVFLLYTLIRIGMEIFKGEFKIKHGLQLIAAFAFSLVLAMPQLILTYPLALMSSRTGLTESYAYVGSLSPAALVTLIYPAVQSVLRGNCLYVGIISIFFISFAVGTSSVRKQGLLRIWIVMGLVCLLLALGRWSPLYVVIIKATEFHAFRMPAKFLGFFCFSLSVLAGYGFDALQKRIYDRSFSVKKEIYRIFFVIYLLFFVIAFSIYLMFVFGRNLIFELGKWAVELFIYGQQGHPHSYEIYLNKLNLYLDAIYDLYDLSHLPNIWQVFVIFLSGYLIFLFMRRRLRIKIFLMLAFMLTLIDLYGFAWLDIKKDFDYYASIRPDAGLKKVLNEEKNEKRLNRLMNWVQDSNWSPLSASQNMLYGVKVIGAYSPFVIARYHETVGRFGVTNDSNVVFNPDKDFLTKRLNLLRSLGVTHILADKTLDKKDFLLIWSGQIKEQVYYLYRLLGDIRKAYFLASYETYARWDDLKERYLAEGFDPQTMLLLLNARKEIDLSVKRETEKADINQEFQRLFEEQWFVDAPSAGYFVLNKTFYPNWTAQINGRKVEIEAAYGMFMAVKIPASGKHRIHLRYQKGIV